MFSTGQVRRTVNSKIGIPFRVLILCCLWKLLKLLSLCLVLVGPYRLTRNFYLKKIIKEIPLSHTLQVRGFLRGPIDELELHI